MSKLNNMWQKIWGKQMNQIVEKVEQITANGKHADQVSVGRTSRPGRTTSGPKNSGTSYFRSDADRTGFFLVQDFKNNLAGEAQKEVLKENFYKELIVQEEIRRRQKALDVADDRLKIQVTK